jgi:hypothetical protein
LIQELKCTKHRQYNNLIPLLLSVLYKAKENSYAVVVSARDLIANAHIYGWPNVLKNQYGGLPLQFIRQLQYSAILKHNKAWFTNFLTYPIKCFKIFLETQYWRFPSRVVGQL